MASTITGGEFNELLSATVQKIEKTLVDQVMTAHPTLDLFKKNIKSATGTSVIIPVAATLGSTVQADSSGSFSYGVDSEVVASVKYDWASPLVSKVSVAWADLQQNSGPEAVVALAKAHLDSAIGGHSKFLAEHLHYTDAQVSAIGDPATATAIANELGHFLSLDQIINVGNPTATNATGGVGKWSTSKIGISTAAATSGTASLVIGTPSTDTTGLAAGDKIYVTGCGPRFDGYRTILTKVYSAGSSTTTVTFSSPGVNVTSFGPAAGSLSEGIWNSIRKYAPSGSSPNQLGIFEAFRATSNDIFTASGKRPTAIICGRDVYDEYENELDDNVRYTMMATAESRFQELRFDGMIVRLDPDAAVDRAYFLNEDALVARYLNNNFMKVMPAQVVTGTLDTVTPLASVVAFGANERRAHGLLIRNTVPV